MLFIITKAILITWLLLTIPWQFIKIRETNKFFLGLSRFIIFPIYTFFSPKPGIFDTHLIYRDMLEDKTTTEWVEIALINKRTIYNFLWNPEKKLNKLVSDAISELKIVNNYFARKKFDKQVTFVYLQTSRGYLALLNFVFAFSKISPNAVQRQFAIIEVSNAEQGRRVSPLFTSAIHNL